MHKIIKPAIVLLFFPFLWSCQTAKEEATINTNIPEEYVANVEEQVQQRREEIEISAVEIPDWFTEPESTGDFISSVATATSSDLQMSIISNKN